MSEEFKIAKYYTNFRGMHLLIYIKKYLPLLPCDKNTAFVDVYYKAYQELYFFKKRERAEFEARGIACDNVYPDIPYKDLLVELGMGVRLNNQLVYINGIGTFFAAEVLKTSIAVTENAIIELPITKTNPCEDCDKCARVCPSGALDGKGGYERDKCIRQMQEDVLEEDSPYKKAVGNRVLGCNNCQLACPMNAGIKAIGYSEEEKNKFELNNFLSESYSGKEAWAWYEGYVGKNFARKTKFRSFIENAIEQAQNKD